MRAAVVHEHGDIDRISIESNFPEPQVQDGWAKIRIHATSLNYHDIFSRRGMPGIKLPLPLIIGSDIAGEVVELGNGAENAQIGDRVLIDPINPKLGMIGERWNGGRAEYCVAEASQLVPIPGDVPDRRAALVRILLLMESWT